MYISIVCFIKLTSSYKSQKFVSLIDAPYFKNAFAPGASIRRNTVFFIGNPQYPQGAKKGVFSFCMWTVYFSTNFDDLSPP